MDWRRVIEEIAFSGRSGLTRTDLFTKLRTLFPDYKFDQVTEELVWKRICRQPEVEALVDFIRDPIPSITFSLGWRW